MKKILITGGPTNEYIDEVMKITNMSSGKIAIELAEKFVHGGYDTTLLITKGIKNPLIKDLEKNGCKVYNFETTEELYKLLSYLSQEQYDVIIHSAAVADYKPEYSFRLEDMATEIAKYINDNKHLNEAEMEKLIFNILKNPDCKVNDDTKISSVEPNLTVKLGLTPKIIKSLRDWYPNAYICGFKLLENVPEEELVAAAMKQLESCQTDLVFANDLAELRKGNMSRLVITSKGNTNIRVDGAEGIYTLIKIANFDFSE